MSKTPKVAGVAHVNGLIFITSLHEREKGLTLRIVDDLSVLLEARKVPYEIFEPSTAKDLLDKLDQIAHAAETTGYKPILHFDTHGGKLTGIHIAESGEDIPWLTMTDKLRAINAGTENNLCVISLACFGFHLVEGLSISLPTPFYILAAPENEITAGEIEENVHIFYDHLFGDEDIFSAFNKSFAGKLRILLSEEFFLDVLTRYFVQGCTGKGAKKRVEYLVSEARRLMHGGGELKLLRKIAKKGVRPRKEVMDRYVDIFLLGKPAAFTFGQVLSRVSKTHKLMEEQRKREDKVRKRA